MAARNKPPGFKCFGGRIAPTLINLPVQAGSTQAIKQGEVCKMTDPSDIASSPIIPVSANETGFIPLIAMEEQKATNAARMMQFAIATPDVAFEFALDTATEVKIGDKIQIHDSQTVKVSSDYTVAAAWIEPVNETPTWQSVSKVFVVFGLVRAEAIKYFPLVGKAVAGSLTGQETDLDTVIADPGDAGAIPITGSGTVPLVTAGAETRTVADATYAGQLLSLALKTDGGDCVVTFASPFNQAGDLTITLNDAGDSALFTAVEDGADVEWRLVRQNGCSGMIGADDSDLDTVIADPGDAGAIPVTGSGTVPLVTAGAETRTVADPTYAGQVLNLALKTDGGDCVITFASPINQAGRTTLTFNDAGDSAMLHAVEDGADIEWRVINPAGMEGLDIDEQDLGEVGNLDIGVPVLVQAICTAGGAEDESVLASAPRKMKIVNAWMIARDANNVNVTLKNATNAFTGAVAKGAADDALIAFDTIIAEHDEVAAGAAIIATFSGAGSAEVFLLCVPIA